MTGNIVLFICGCLSKQSIKGGLIAFSIIIVDGDGFVYWLQQTCGAEIFPDGFDA
jgi:hypothetical protein